MTSQTFYHFDRRSLLKSVLNSKETFKNNVGKLNGFFMFLGIDQKAIEDFGSSLLIKVNDFVFMENLKLDFVPELISQFEKNKNEIVQKVLFELLFEDIRRDKFKNSPSRTKSLFVVESIESLEHWKKSLSEEGTTYKLTAIQISSLHEADSTWFESCNIDNIRY